MATIRMAPPDFARYLERLGPRFEPAMRRGLLSAAMASVPVLQQATRQAPPASPSGVGSGGAVDRGAYLRSWKAAPTPEGARVWNDQRYASVIEHGRRPGALQPNARYLVPWVRRKLHVSAKDAPGVAYLVARAIKRRGLRARRVLTDVVGRLQAVALREVRRELEAEIRREAGR